MYIISSNLVFKYNIMKDQTPELKTLSNWPVLRFALIRYLSNAHHIRQMCIMYRFGVVISDIWGLWRVKISTLLQRVQDQRNSKLKQFYRRREKCWIQGTLGSRSKAWRGVHVASHSCRSVVWARKKKCNSCYIEKSEVEACAHSWVWMKVM